MKMVELTGKGPIWVNPDHVVAVELSPPGVGITTTAVALSNGHVLYVRESVAEVVDRLKGPPYVRDSVEEAIEHLKKGKR